MTSRQKEPLTSHRGRGWELALTALVLALVAAACGSQRTSGEFAAVYAGSDSSSGAGMSQVGGLEAGESSSSGSEMVIGDAGSPALSEADSAAESTSQPGAAPIGPADPVNSETSTGAGTPSGASPRDSNPGAPIRIGSVGTLSGPIGSAIGNGAPAVQTWAAFINSQGGINGHPVEIFVADDGGDPARHRALVQQMVEEKKVIAFVHNAAALSGQAAVPYLEGKRIPVLGSEAGSPWVNSSPMYFPQQASDARLALSFAAGYSTLAKQMGLSKIALLSCAEIQGCQTSTQGKPFRDAGLDVVYEARGSLAQPSYTSQCLSARDKGAQIFVIGLDAQSAQRVADNCKSVGFTPVFGIVPQAVTSVLARKPGFEGSLVVLQTAPWFQTSIPGVAEFQKAMSSLAPGIEQNGSSIQGWTSAKMFEAAARKGGDPTTSAGILAGLYALGGDDLGGLTYPLTFVKGAPNNAASSSPCWWDVQIRGGKFVSPDGGKRHCP